MFVYIAQADPYHPDILAQTAHPCLRDKKMAERALKAYIEDFPGDDPPPGILEIEVTQEF